MVVVVPHYCHSEKDPSQKQPSQSRENRNEDIPDAYGLPLEVE